MTTNKTLAGLKEATQELKNLGIDGRQLRELLLDVTEGTQLGYALRLAERCADISAASILCTLVHYKKWTDMENAQTTIIRKMAPDIAKLTHEYNGDEDDASEIMNQCMQLAIGFAEDYCGVPRSDPSKGRSMV